VLLSTSFVSFLVYIERDFSVQTPAYTTLDIVLWLGFDYQHIQIIQQHYKFLLENLVGSTLVDELYQAKVLSKGEVESIGAEATLTAQNKKLLSVLNRKTKEQFDQFLDALDKTGQQYIREKISAEMKYVSY